MNRKQQLAGMALLAALVMAFLLRDVVEQMIIRPAMYLFWVVSVYYHYIPQPVLWLLLVVVMIYLSLGRLARKFEPPALRPKRSSFVQGPVDELAQKIERKEGGIYFKWQIAHFLGQIAMEMQELRLHTRSRNLEFNGGTARPQVRLYLDAGLNTSFSDYPIPGGLPVPGKSKSTSSTPFDGDINPVIDYLESEMENDDDLRRP
jgi:hypothetical protein